MFGIVVHPDNNREQEYLIVDEMAQGSIPCNTAGSGRGKTGAS